MRIGPITICAAAALVSTYLVPAWAHDMSPQTISHYGRALSLWMDVREGCAEGDGSNARIATLIGAFNTAASRNAGILQVFGNVHPTVHASAAYTEATQDLLNSPLNPNEHSSIALGTRISSTLRALNLISNEVRRIRNSGEPSLEQPGQTATGLIGSLMQKANQIHRAVNCKRAEDEIRFIVSRTARSIPAEDASTAELPQTLGDRGFDVRGGHCQTLDQVSDSLANIIQDSNEAILSGVPYYERAVISQMVVEYVKKHGGRQGVLNPTRQTRLRELVTSALARFEGEHVRMAAAQ